MSTATANPNPNPAANGVPVEDPWAIKVPSAGAGGDYVACPPGNHPGTIVGAFDVGHQPGTDMKGGAVTTRQLIVVFELTKKRPDGKPFVLAKQYTWSMHEKSNLYKDVVSVTGRKFKEGDSFRPPSLMGLPVMVSVSNTQSGEKVYHNVASIAQFPDGFPAPAATIAPVCWTVLGSDPLPSGLDWVPYVYGRSLADLVETATETTRGRGPVLSPAMTPVTPAAPDDPDSPF